MSNTYVYIVCFAVFVAVGVGHYGTSLWPSTGKIRRNLSFNKMSDKDTHSNIIYQLKEFQRHYLKKAPCRAYGAFIKTIWWNWYQHNYGVEIHVKGQLMLKFTKKVCRLSSVISTYNSLLRAHMHLSSQVQKRVFYLIIVSWTPNELVNV